MKMQDARIEKHESTLNPHGIQLEAPMQQIAAPGVYEMKPYPGDDSRWYSTVPGG